MRLTICLLVCLFARVGHAEDKTAAATPEDWPGQLASRLNAGDLAGVLALYDENARLITGDGQTKVGHDQLREIYQSLINARTQLTTKLVRVERLGDTALLYTDMTATLNNEQGEPVHVSLQAIEVLKRQPDGHWKLLIGDPQGRQKTAPQPK